MREFPLWFGPEERSLFATAYVPDDSRASGFAVLCPPLGLEGVCVRRTFAELGRSLADAGVVALRFDYDGTGDSCGSNEERGRVPAWIEGIQHAVEFGRQSGVSKIAVVGMRLGATLAAVAMSEAAGGSCGELLDGLVLWDPCISGLAYLRAQRALHSLSVGRSTRDGGDASVEVPGFLFHEETVGELASVDLAAVEGPLARRIRVLIRSTRPHGTGALEQFAVTRPVEWGTAHGQERLVDVEPFAAEVPRDSLHDVAAWLSETLAGECVPVSVAGRDAAVVGRDESGPILERPVSLGPFGLFGIVTESSRAQRAEDVERPTIVFLNSGIIDHTGPARLWVDLGRRWAEQGLRCVRCDLSGLGDSAPRDGQPVDVTYPPEALEDLLDVAAAASPANPANVVLVGLCSGGYHAIEGAIALGARGVCVINPILTHKPGELRGEGAAPGAPVDVRRQAAPVRRHWIRALPAHDQLGALLQKMPDPVWWLVNRIAVEHGPASTLRKLVDHGVQTFIVSGERESRLMWRGEGRALRRLERSELFQHVELPGIDHELFGHDARELVSAIVTRQVVDAYACTGRIQSSDIEGLHG